MKVQKNVLEIRAVRLWVGLFAEDRNIGLLILSVFTPGTLYLGDCLGEGGPSKEALPAVNAGCPLPIGVTVAP